jgi:hypothetical protein
MKARNQVSDAITLFTPIKYGFLGVKVTNIFCVCRCLKLQIGCVRPNIMLDKTEYKWKAVVGGDCYSFMCEFVCSNLSREEL